MIVPMKRLTLLCLTSAVDETLRALQDLGAVHVTSQKPPDSRDLETARNHLAYVKRVLETIPAKSTTPPSGLPAAAVTSLVWTLLQDKKDLEDALSDLREERARVRPFGNFDPARIAALRENGIDVKLYTASTDVAVDVPEGAALVEIDRDKTTRHLALIARDDVSLPLPEFRVPDQSPAAMDAAIADHDRRLAETIANLKNYDGDHHAIAALRDELVDRVNFLDAREGMGSYAPVAGLSGYLPAENADALLAAARQEGWGVTIDDPAPDEEVPTLIRNPQWVKPIESVLKAINVLPGYREVDMSPVFLIFFSIFFSMLIGDAGYGALFLAGTLFARHKFPNAPSEPFILLTITSLGTILWGALSGNYFGLSSGIKIEALADNATVMGICFLIAAAHLSVAHVWNIVRFFPNKLWLAQLGWLMMTWVMYFLANDMVLGKAFPSVMYFPLGLGALLILLFMTPVEKLKEEWHQHVMFPLNLVSNFVDVVSYIRLFAVGSATFAVASVFNQMAADIGMANPISALIAALILFLGHALNIVLGAMGVLVHGVRLNTLEFSSHLGVQWTGHAYEPFARKHNRKAGPTDNNH